MKKPYCCFCKHVKTYKRHYIYGLFGSFAVINMIVFFVGFFGALYHTQYHASAAGPSYINPVTFCNTVTQIPQQECGGLVDIYNSTDGQNRTNNTNRGLTTNVCSWNGVVCGTPGHVTHINLSNNNLVGNITSNIQYLSELIGIDISYNTISTIDPIPSGSLTYLLTFNASYNQLGDVGGFDSLVYLKNIKNIDLSHNNITEIPLGYPNISGSITHLNLGYNQITDFTTITAAGGTSLVSLYLDHNNISKIPDSYLKLANVMISLNLSYNKINDFLPITTPGSDSLISLYLGHNIIQKVPSNIKNLTSLENLDLSKNLINEKTVIYIGDLWTTLISLNLAHNLIKVIPATFSNFGSNNTLLYLDMSYNYLTNAPYIDGIYSLIGLNLSDNQLTNMIKLNALTSLQSIDYGFNKLTKFPIAELLSVKNTLKSFSLRHQRDISRPGKMAGDIPNEIVLLTALDNASSKIDYNRLRSYNVTDPVLLDFLDQKFVNTSNVEDDLNTNRLNQYQKIEIKFGMAIDTPYPIHAGDAIDIRIDYTNVGVNPTSILDLSLFDQPGIFTIQSPTGFPMIKGSTFDGNDYCFKQLSDNTTGPYYTTLNTRATNNGRASFAEYLLSPEHDYDLYNQTVPSNNPYPMPLRGKSFISRISAYIYDAFMGNFRRNLNTALFDMDVNDYAINGCGNGGKQVTSYNISPLAAGDNGSVTLTLKIDDNFVGNINLESILESDDRLYIQDTIAKTNLMVKVEAKPVDTDKDGVNDPVDNCPLVMNSGQENSNYISPVGPSVYFEKTDYADRTDPANQDCITSSVCLTRQDSQGIYNAYLESVYDGAGNTSPADTERAFGTCDKKDILTFDTRYNTIWGGGYSGPLDMIGNAMCIHLITDNKYYDIIFSGWTIGGIGGGFSYTRAEYNSNIVNYGDACDCTDSICTTGTNISGVLICDPVDPACPVPFCGDGNIDSGEICDNTNLSGYTCGNFGYSQGTLSCTSCTAFNTGACSNPAPTPPPPVTPPSGGGGGGSLHVDPCPNGDYSQSYYDNTCGTPPPTTPPTTPSKPVVVDERPITRLELAQLVVPFALDVLDLTIYSQEKCVFSDIANLSKNNQSIVKMSCRLRLMGREPNGLDIKPIYVPNTIVRFNEFVTVYSRIINDGRYNIMSKFSLTPWYENHLTALKKADIVSNPVTITKSYVQSMLAKIQQNPDMIKRSDINIGHAIATTPVIVRPAVKTGSTVRTGIISTSPTTSLSLSLKNILLDLSRFFGPVSSTGTTTTGTAITGQAHGSATTTPVVQTINLRSMMRDLSRFLQ